MVDLTLEETLGGIREFEDQYRQIYFLPVFAKLRDPKQREIFFESIPKPSSFVPDYTYEGKKFSLEEAASFSFPGLEEIISNTYNFLPKIEGALMSNVLRKAHLINFTIFTILDEEVFGSFKDLKNRKYEKIPAFTHAWKTQLLLPKNAPNWVIIYALSHDSIEDSHRHKALKEWISLKEGQQLPIFSKLLLLGAFPFLSPLSFEEPLSIPLYDSLLGDQTNQFLDLLYLGQPNSRDKARLKKGLMFITKKEYQPYSTYLSGIKKIRNAYTRYWTIITKMDDRFDNSHFNPVFYNSHFLQTGEKLLKDGIKNVQLLNVAQEIYLGLENRLSEKPISELARGELSKLEFLKRKNSLAALTNNNMNYFMNYIREVYGERVISLRYKYYSQHTKETKTVNEWLDLLEKRIYDYYSVGGFSSKDSELGNPKILFSLSGSLTLLDKLFEGEIETIFGRLNTYNALLLYKYAAITKVFSCLYLSHNPFVNGRLVIRGTEVLGLDTLGTYDQNLRTYVLEESLIN